MSRKSSSRIPDVDPKSPMGLALTTAVQGKLRSYLGADYVDRSLAQYVVVMLAHKTGQEAVGDNLVEFLGEVDAREAASWLFENLDELAKPPPPPKEEEQQQRPQRELRRHHERGREQPVEGGAAAATAGAAAGAAAEAQHEDLELEMEASGGDEDGEEVEEDGGSDADTAELALGGDGHNTVPDFGVRRLHSAVVVEEYRRRDDQRGRSRSRSPRCHSPPPRRRRSYSPGGGVGRRRTPPRRRSPPRSGRYFWEGGEGARYHEHDPYPYRTGAGGWRDGRSPPRRRSPSPCGTRGHGQGHGSGADWRQPWSPRGVVRQAPPQAWDVQQPDGNRLLGRLQQWEAGGGGGGGGGGAFRSLQHFQHDVRWEEGEEGLPRRRSGGDVPPAAAVTGPLRLLPAGMLGPPPVLAPGMLHPGRRGQGTGAGSPYQQQQNDAGMAEELVRGRQQAGAAAGEQSGRHQQQLLPWERPSHMDLELERQRQVQQQQKQATEQAVVETAAGAPPRLSLVPAAAAAPVAGATARPLVPAAAASLNLNSRNVSAVPLLAQPGGFASAHHHNTFQVTITQPADQGQGQRQGVRRLLMAPLLQQPDLQVVLRQRVRQMELELVRLRTEQAQHQLIQAQQQQHLSAATQLDLTVRSVCIKGVHPSASDRVLIAHFGTCGYIQRITHLRDPSSGRRSGVVYMQFSTSSQAQAALALDGSALLQRAIQVVPTDSPAARVAASRVLHASFPPPCLVPLPVFAAPISPRVPMGRSHYRGSGSGRGGGGRGHRSFKYVRATEQPTPGSGTAGDPGTNSGAWGGSKPGSSAAVAAAPSTAAPAAGNTGGKSNSGDSDHHMAD